MFYVYFIRSIADPTKTYIGYTSDLKARLKAHNSGASTHTARFLPWTLEHYHAFEDKQKALAFERYLKSGSGQAFAKRHF